MQRSVSFEHLVARIYRELGARVEHNKNIGGLQVDVFVTHATPDGATIRTAVECKAHARSLGVGEAVEACQKLSSLRAAGLVDKGVIVSENGFTQDARSHCASLLVEAFVPDDLQRRVADFSSYLNDIVSGQGAPEEYIELIQKGSFISLPARKEDDRPIDSIIDFLNEWMLGNGQFLALLGEYGSGKTTTVWHTAQRFADQYLRTGRGRLPLVIELKRFSQNFSLRSFLTDFLLNQRTVKIDSYATFERLNKEGRFILLFDGFDEMMTRPEPSLVFRHLDEIFQLAQSKAKIVLTCRTSFFKDRSDLERLKTSRDLHSLLHKHRSYQVVNLSGFTAEQLQHYLYCYYGSAWVDFYHELKKSRISSLADRPILLNMIVNTIGRSEDLVEINAAELYERYTAIWLQRDNWRCHLTPEQRTNISKILAFELVRQQSPGIHHGELRRRVNSYFGDEMPPDVLDQYAHEVRTCTFLKNDLQGVYRFAHRSFAEFLASKHMLDQMVLGNYTLLGESVSLETLDFLSELVANNRKNQSLRYIWDILQNRPGESHIDPHVLEVAVYLLLHCKESLADANLRNIGLPDGADLKDADLRGADCLRMRGTQICFDGASLDRASLRESTLRNCSFGGASMCGTDLENADLSGSDLSTSDLRGANFCRTNLEDVLLTPSDVLASDRLNIAEEVREEQQRLGEVPNLHSLFKAIRTEGFLRKQTRRSMGMSGVDSRSRGKRRRLDILLEAVLQPYQQDNYDLLENLVLLKRSIGEDFEIVEASFQRRLEELGKKEDGINVDINAEHKKRAARQRHREFQLAKEHALRQIEIIIDRVKLLGQLDQESQPREGPKVEKAVFSANVGMKRQQIEWLKQHGAILR